MLSRRTTQIQFKFIIKIEMLILINNVNNDIWVMQMYASEYFTFDIMDSQNIYISPI